MASWSGQHQPLRALFLREQAESSPSSSRLWDNATWQQQVLFEFANVPYLLPFHWASAEKLTSRFIGDNSTLAFWSAQHHLQTLGPIIAKFHRYRLKRPPLTYGTFDVVPIYHSPLFHSIFQSFWSISSSLHPPIHFFRKQPCPKTTNEKLMLINTQQLQLQVQMELEPPHQSWGKDHLLQDLQPMGTMKPEPGPTEPGRW